MPVMKVYNHRGKDHLAFVNPNGEIVLMIVNTEENDKKVSVDVKGKIATMKLKGKSINTIVFGTNKSI
jgi:glucosylceramidase